MCGARRKRRPCRYIRREAGGRENRSFCWSAVVDGGTTHKIRREWRRRFATESRTGGTVILAGDVGGTKCNLALFAEKNGTLTPVFRKRFASKEFAQFDLIVKEFSRLAAPHLASDPVLAAGFGVAGPVISNHVRATNLPWTVDAQLLSSELDVPKIVLLNDLGATGHSIGHLPIEEFCVLNPGQPEPGGTRAAGRGDRAGAVNISVGRRGLPDRAIGRRAFRFCAAHGATN